MDPPLPVATVAGEPVERLYPIVQSIRFSRGRRRGTRITGHLDHEQGACLMRALMRVEAELLLHDAENVTERGEPRTQAQRRADAFVALVLRVLDAVEEESRHLDG